MCDATIIADAFVSIAFISNAYTKICVKKLHKNQYKILL